MVSIGTRRTRESVVIDGFTANGEPVLEGEVDALSHVEARVEARVIGARARDHELSLLLQGCIDGDSSLIWQGVNAK